MNANSITNLKKSQLLPVEHFEQWLKKLSVENILYFCQIWIVIVLNFYLALFLKIVSAESA